MPNFSLGEFAEFFRETSNGTYKCAFCANETFAANLVGDPKTPEIFGPAAMMIIPGKLDEPPGIGAEYHFYSISCRKCGRTDFFHNNQIDAWRKQKAAKSG
jgi:hypothetical protein